MTKPYVRPDAQAYLDAMEASPRPPMNDQTIAMMRQIPPEMMEQMFAMMELPVGVLGEDRKLAMPGPAGDIDLRLFDPRAAADRAPGPVVVFYHGGGFVAGSVASHASLAAEIARGLDLPVVSVEYRLAPEHKWPAAPDDAEAAARWIAENGAAFGREFTHLILCGDSAGGTLTCVTANALCERPASLPLLMQFPIYPMCDSTRKYPSRADFADGYVLSSVDMAYFESAYAADNHSPRHSAILGDLAKLPPTFVVTAGLDPLRDEGRAYAARCAEAGVQVTYREYPATVHGCFTFRKAIPSAQADLTTALGIAKSMVAEVLAGA